MAAYTRSTANQCVTVSEFAVVVKKRLRSSSMKTAAIILFLLVLSMPALAEGIPPGQVQGGTSADPGAGIPPVLSELERLVR
jgi:hypothetical protein